MVWCLRSNMDMRVSRVSQAVGVTLCIPLFIFQKAACTFDLDANVQLARLLIAGAERIGEERCRMEKQLKHSLF